jgi:Secretion system C-terminal sorting domain/Right handed beta helix region
MKKLFTLFLAIICSPIVLASSINASTFGYNPTNATTALQNAMQSSNDTIVVDLQVSDWNIGPINLFTIQNKVFIFQKNVKIRAIAGLFPATTGLNTCLFRMVNCSNIQFIGYQAEFIMNKPEYVALNNSEFRHCLNLTSCTDFSIFGLTFRDSGGDGIYVGGEEGFGIIGYCNNILIEDVKCINNYRQGMSICSAQNMTVRHSSFSDTIGTLPEAGIDVEPYQITQRIVNLNIENCSFTNNGWSGIALALFEMNNTSLPVSIKVKDCYFKNNNRPGNTYAHSEIQVSADDNNPVQGNVEFERCFIDGSQYAAFYSRKIANAYLVKFKDCVFQNVSQLQQLYNEPIFLEVPDYDNPSQKLGGYVFDNVLLTYNTNFNFFRVFGAPTLQGLSNISGNITVVQPNNNSFLYSNVPVIDTNVNYTFSTQTSLPSTLVSLNQLQATAIECNATVASYEMARSSSKIDYPLGVNYSNAGNVVFGDDVRLMTGGLVIPTNTTSKSENIIARKDLISETDESVLISITSNPLYSATLNIANFTIKDCGSLGIEDKNFQNLKVYPNPAKDSFSIQSNTAFQNEQLAIFDMLGRNVKNITITNSLDKINITSLAKGTYLLKFDYNNKKPTLKLVVE